MLRNIAELMGYVLRASDGDIGRCKDFYFDDRLWTIRYMVADTGKWLSDRNVLISPQCLEKPDHESRRMNVAMTKQEIRNAPSVSEDLPVSRQSGVRSGGGLELPLPWSSTPSGGIASYGTPGGDGAASTAAQPGQPLSSLGAAESQCLRSVAELMRYSAQAHDGETGRVEDFVVDDDDWSLHLMSIDVGKWLSRDRVAVTPRCVARFDHPAQLVHLNPTVEQLEQSPSPQNWPPTSTELSALVEYFQHSFDWSIDDERTRARPPGPEPAPGSSRHSTFTPVREILENAYCDHLEAAKRASSLAESEQEVLDRCLLQKLADEEALLATQLKGFIDGDCVACRWFQNTTDTLSVQRRNQLQELQTHSAVEFGQALLESNQRWLETYNALIAQTDASSVREPLLALRDSTEASQRRMWQWCQTVHDA